MPEPATRTRAPSAILRRPEDAPSLPGGPPRPSPSDPAGELPEVLARAVKAPATPQEQQEQAVDADPPADPAPPAPAGAGTEVVPAGQTAADVERTIRWLGVVYRPPDVWRQRQPSLEEEWRFVLDGSHLPESGPWRAAARAYAAPALALISALHLAVWVLRSPARHATAWVLAAAVVIGVYLV